MIPLDKDNPICSTASGPAVPYEDRPCPGAALADLSAGYMQEYLRETGCTYRQVQDRDLISMAEDMKVLAGTQENPVPANAAVLMFCPDPEKFFPYARTEVAYMPRLPGGPVSVQTFAQPLHIQLWFALQHIKDCAVGEMVIKHPDVPEAERVFSFPKYAIDEVLANAVYCHSYQTREPIKVRITPTGITVTCYPRYAPGITEEDIISGNLQGWICGNERIWGLLKAAGLAEGEGAGYPESSMYLSRNGSGPLEFGTDPDMRSLSVTIPVHTYFMPKVSEKDKKFRDMILKAIKGDAMSYTELAAAMGYKAITRKLSAAIEEMIADNTLIRVPAGAHTKLKAVHPVSG